MGYRAIEKSAEFADQALKTLKGVASRREEPRRAAAMVELQRRLGLEWDAEKQMATEPWTINVHTESQSDSERCHDWSICYKGEPILHEGNSDCTLGDAKRLCDRLNEMRVGTFDVFEEDTFEEKPE